MKSLSTFVSCECVCVFSHGNHERFFVLFCVCTHSCVGAAHVKTKQSINMKSLYRNCIQMSHSISGEQKVPFALSLKKLMIGSAHQLTEATFRLQAKKSNVWPSWKMESSGIKRSIQKWKYLLMDRKSPVLSHPFFVSVCVTEFFCVCVCVCVYPLTHTEALSLSVFLSH